MQSKKCSNPECQLEKPLSEFYKNKNKKGGLENRCKTCSNKLKVQYRIENKIIISEKGKQYYKKHKDRIDKKNKKYYETEEGREADRRKASRRQALKKSTEDGTITKESLKKLRDKQNNKCYYCECELNFKSKNEVHLDHHIPLSKGGIHGINNVVYLCKKCNLSKSDMMPKTLLLI